jgi:hypothetical protein
MTLANELHAGRSRSTSNHADMQALLNEVIESEVELAFYILAARIAVARKAD